MKNIYFCRVLPKKMIRSSAPRSERCIMHNQTVRYARNGAFGAIALYLLIAVPLLGLSMHKVSNPERHASTPGVSSAALAAPATAIQTNR